MMHWPVIHCLAVLTGVWLRSKETEVVAAPLWLREDFDVVFQIYSCVWLSVYSAAGEGDELFGQVQARRSDQNGFHDLHYSTVCQGPLCEFHLFTVNLL